MLLLKTLLFIALFIFNSMSYAQNLSLNEAKMIAGEYFKKESKAGIKSRLTYDVQETIFKNSFLMRVNYLELMDVPATLIAVGPDKNAKKITVNKDLKTFLTELNVLLKQESINIKNSDEAKVLLKKLVNIYGIYESDIKCKTLENSKKYSCKISNSSPRKTDDEVIIDNQGLNSIQ